MSYLGTSYIAYACVAWFTFFHTFSSTAEPPGALLDLSLWKLTLPVDTARKGRPDEIRQPELASFVDDNHFYADTAKGGVVFRAYAEGIPTKGSTYPRSELREMTADPDIRAQWSTEDPDLHTMLLQLAVTATPSAKPHVVCAQIHNAEQDVLMVRLEGKKLFIERKPLDDIFLTRRYELGTFIKIKIQAGNRRIKLWIDNQLAMDWPVVAEGCYFKAGCYTQSNPSRGDRKGAYGEVVISSLKLD